MRTLKLPGGKTADVSLTMKEFRGLWIAGDIDKLTSLGQGSDLGEIYPVLVQMVQKWDCVDTDGKSLDPKQIESYDALEPNVFLKLMSEAAGYIGGVDGPN